MISVILFKMGKHGDFYLSFFQIVGAWRDCTVVIKLLESFLRVYMVSGDAVSKYGLEPYFKVHNLVSVHPKSIILGQVTNLNMILHVLVSVYWFLKIWNSPQFPDEFPNGQLHYLLLISDIANQNVWKALFTRVVYTDTGVITFNLASKSL